MSDPLQPDGVTWRQVNPALARGYWLYAVSVSALVAAAAIATAVRHASGTPWVLIGALVAIELLVTGGLWWLIRRRVAAIGYAERGEELLIRTGILTRRLVIVPYSRLQYVTVTTGVLARLWGYTAVHLHTASPLTAAYLPGLPPEQAAWLRDRVAERGAATAPTDGLGL